MRFSIPLLVVATTLLSPVTADTIEKTSAPIGDKSAALSIGKPPRGPLTPRQAECYEQCMKTCHKGSKDREQLDEAYKCWGTQELPYAKEQ
ncbi:hypothetical protein CcaCcLH18_02094 [Colletotrichum camelliae]|nr:hypothetical protein CcaCcLH18_02094 [Colletotrichum camelliae]